MPRVLLILLFALLLVCGCAGAPQQASQPGALLGVIPLDPLPVPKGQPAEHPRIDAKHSPEDLAKADGPRNDRDWIPEHRLLAFADLEGENVRVHNVRNAEFFSYRDCIVDYYDETYDLSQLKSVDFVMIPFNDARYLAHTMLSFGFENGDYVGVSVEVRLEKGESYDAAIGLFNQFELIYVVADERDLIRVRTEFRDVDVLIYPTKATPEQGRKLFVDIMKRVNKLKDEPEYYDTLSNNCTTNIVRHINALAPDAIPHDFRVLLPGYADNLAYDLGLIDNSVPFAEARRRARVNDLALRYRDDQHFSQRIRGQDVPQNKLR